MRFSRPLNFAHRRRPRGVALVIVLAMVVLVTGVVLAFFSRALSERQISGSSSSQTKVDLFAQAASNSIIGDFQQEIAAGSSQPFPTPTPGTATLYIPASGATAVPYQAGTGNTATANPLPNLVKRSASGQSFFAGTAYDTTNYPPSSRAAGPTTKSSTLVPSLNGRTITAVRWNKPLLLPKKTPGGTDATPITTYTPPDWVLVARDGSNPTVWDTSLISTPTGSKSVIGRYAYNIYDEGGVLDANAAGYLTASNAYPSSGSTSLPFQPTRKSALAYADLTVPVTLSDGSTQPLLTAAQLNALVGWRNFASAQVSGAFPNYTPAPTPTATKLSPFDVAMLTTTKGFLSVANSALYPPSGGGQSDRMFASRQQLLDFLLQSVATGSADVAKLQNSLQYLGSFSREFNQPSYAPLPAAATPDTTHRPPIVPMANGGNDVNQAGTTGVTGPNTINPSFLAARVATTKTGGRSDGSDLVQGEPLVKKRFALSRLAWLTFKGPIADDNGNLSSDADIQNTILPALRNAGFADAFLKQGSPTNIYKYFGLSWVNDPNDSAQKLWVYNHEGTTFLTAPTPSSLPIRTLTGGSNPVAGREADFFELLRGGINVGAVGKIGNPVPATPPSNPDPNVYQSELDVMTSGAIIQVGANIIDQFDMDSFPTRILYTDGSLSQAPNHVYSGVEDLPYFYRARGSAIKLKESDPAFTSPQPDPPTSAVPSGTAKVTFKDPGLGAAFEQPEIWNPHAWNPNATPVTLRPSTFRVTATTGLPSTALPTTGDVNSFTALPRNRYNTITNNGAYTDCSPGAPATGSTTPMHPIVWTPDNTAILFDILKSPDRSDLFREPTLLIKPNIPTGSNLRLGSQNLLASGSETALGPYLGTGGALKNLASSPFYATNGTTDNQLYFGFYLGAFPLAWTIQQNSITYLCNTFLLTGPGGKVVTYRVQYESSPGSGDWITYDEKPSVIAMNSAANFQATSGARPNWLDPIYSIGNDSGLAYTDPRTARFGAATCAWQYNQSRQVFEWPPTYSPYGSGTYNAGGKPGAAAPTATYSGNTNAAAQNALWTLRPDVYSGFKAWPYPFAMGFYPSGENAQTAGPHFRPGMLSQNNPAANAGGTAVANVIGQGSSTQSFFADPDNVVRRGMAGYVQVSSTDAEQSPLTGASSGEPQAVATTFLSAANANGQWSQPINTETASRPIMLNRPFRTVAELGYASSGTPWRNLDFSTPECGYSALLDIFCINDTDDANGLAAGKVNLNTRQAPVLQAILAGAYRDEFAPTTLFTTPPLTATGSGFANAASAIATLLVKRTSDTTSAASVGTGPLMNVSDLVGKWVGPVAAISPSYDGGQSYKGFSGVNTTTSTPSQTLPNLSYILSKDATVDGYNSLVSQRYHAAAIRALTAAGQTRVWNLMIDLIAQTGRYPQIAGSVDKFVVEGEQRCWVHVAIDRFTGQVIDKQVEIVKE